MIKRASKKSDINLNKKKKSPSISRSITESVLSFISSEKYVLIASLLGVFSFCWMLFAVVQLSGVLQIQKQRELERAKVMHEVGFWEEVTKSKPEYRDGYFMLAVLEYRIGKKQEALTHVEKALQIDPNFKQGKEFETLLKSN